MVNQQLLDYIKQQLQLGVTKDAVKSTLLGSGWPEGDVTEAMNSATGAPAAGTAAAVPAQPVGDIFQAKSEATKAEPVAKKAETSFQSKIDTKIDTYQTAQLGATSMMMDTKSGGSRRSWVLPVIEGVIILGLLGGTWYIYNLYTVAQTDAVAKTTSNSDLTKQVNTAAQDKNDLLTQLNDVKEKNAESELNLTFVLAGTATSTITNQVKGTLRGDDKTPYTLVTTRGILLNIKNYKDAKVNVMLKPLLGSAATLKVSYMAGSRDVTVLEINGTPIPPDVPPVATSTATSTKP